MQEISKNLNFSNLANSFATSFLITLFSFKSILFPIKYFNLHVLYSFDLGYQYFKTSSKDFLFVISYPITIQSESWKYIFTKGLLVSKPIVSQKWKITSLLFSKLIFIFVKEASFAIKLYLSDFNLTNLLINDVFAPIPLSPTNTILYSSWKLDSTSCFMTSF